MSHLDYFEPYLSKKPWHEDQLTRTFLVVLRLVPLAHTAFLDMVREYQSTKGRQQIPPLSGISANLVSMETQVEKVSQTSGTLVSIVMTDEHWTPARAVQPSQRGARYDGVICYEPDWILVIENKPSSSNIWEEQLSPNLAEGSEIVVDPVPPVVLVWNEVIERLSSLLQRKLMQGTEALLVDDFLRFIDQHFTYLNPYTSLAICKNDEYLLQRRCLALIEEIAPHRVEHHRGWKDYIKLLSGPVREIVLYPKMDKAREWKIVLLMAVGDTLRQAREFFDHVDRDAFLALQSNGWGVEPNMHFSFMATNLVWATTELALEEYFDFWHSKKREIDQIKRGSAGFDADFQELLSLRLISQPDLAALTEKFTSTKRNSINICPGFEVSFAWEKKQAEQLDSEGRFTETVRSRITEVLPTWGQTFPD